MSTSDNHKYKIRNKLAAIRDASAKRKAVADAALEKASRAVLSVTDRPDSDFKPSDLPPLYKDLDDQQFILKMFNDYVGRKPESAELGRHINALQKRTRHETNESFAYCDEVVRLAGAPVYARPKAPIPEFSGNLRVAVLLTGHLRTFQKTYPTIRKNLVLPLGADVFIHTWSTLGLQKKDPVYGPIPDDSLVTDEQVLRRAMPEACGVAIEDNNAFLSRAKIKDKNPYVLGHVVWEGHKEWEHWVRLSAKPVFIESQIYSVFSAFEMLRHHELSQGLKYDLVIKLRSDMEITSRLPAIDSIDSGIWVANPPESGHDHPTCFACKNGPHEGLHATDVCDIYAYGGRDAMEKYCGLWGSLDAVYNRMCAENIKNVKSPDARYGIIDGQVIFPLWKNGASHKLHGFYPERMLRLLLEGVRLMPGGLVCKIIR